MFTVREIKYFIELGLSDGTLSEDSHVNIDGAEVLEIDVSGGELFLSTEYIDEDDEDE